MSYVGSIHSFARFQLQVVAVSAQLRELSRRHKLAQ